MTFQPTPTRLGLACALLTTVLLAGCGAGPTASAPPAGSVPGQLSNVSVPTPAPAQSPSPQPRSSEAATARDYRRDAARHVYDANRERIYPGKLPPVLYAVGTLQVYLDAGGKVTSMHWMRAPQHAPEVIAEIERTVLAAAPYPAPTRMGTVIWTDTWLWDRDKGGRFQLDTLTEGQQ
ncbi:MAG: hypothetical protein V4636_09490 [Pseudomonadota bacterium]